MLELKDISYEIDNKKILNNINLKIDLNKIVIITGPNGSGKSTLSKIIMGIIKPTEGRIYLDGKDITNLTINERSNLGLSYAFQQPVRFKGITIKDIIDLSTKKENNNKDYEKILKSVGLNYLEYLNREIDDRLSGGEIKRIEIASVMNKKSKFTILDEPEAGIDLWSFNNLIDVFENMRNIIKGTTIIISHQEKILNIADKIILMRDGKIEQIGEAKDVLENVSAKKECCRLNRKEE